MTHGNFSLKITKGQTGTKQQCSSLCVANVSKDCLELEIPENKGQVYNYHKLHTHWHQCCIQIDRAVNSSQYWGKQLKIISDSSNRQHNAILLKIKMAMRYLQYLQVQHESKQILVWINLPVFSGLAQVSPQPLIEQHFCVPRQSLSRTQFEQVSAVLAGGHEPGLFGFGFTV